jgi:hypothetical protein
MPAPGHRCVRARGGRPPAPRFRRGRGPGCGTGSASGPARPRGRAPPPGDRGRSSTPPVCTNTACPSMRVHVSSAGRPAAPGRSAMRSSGSSRPTETRIISSPIPAWRSCWSVICWWVVEPGWITSERRSPTLARCENSSIDSMNRRPASRPPLIPNEKTGAGSLRQQPLRELAVGMRGKLGIGHPLDGVGGLEELDHPTRVGDVPLHPNVQGLQSLDHLRRGIGAHRGPEVPQPLRPGPGDERGRPELIGEVDVVIGGVGLGQGREPPDDSQSNRPLSTSTPPTTVP